MSDRPHKFDHELARELYRRGSGMEALVRRFGVSEQAIRFVVMPEAKQQKTNRRFAEFKREQHRQRLLAERGTDAKGVHKEV